MYEYAKTVLLLGMEFYSKVSAKINWKRMIVDSVRVYLNQVIVYFQRLGIPRRDIGNVLLKSKRRV